MIMKGVLLYTNNGVRLLCKNEFGIYWTKDKAYNYCNVKDKFSCMIRANRLLLKSILVDRKSTTDKYWYKDKNNFKDIIFEINENIFLNKK